MTEELPSGPDGERSPADTAASGQSVPPIQGPGGKLSEEFKRRRKELRAKTKTKHLTVEFLSTKLFGVESRNRFYALLEGDAYTPKQLKTLLYHLRWDVTIDHLQQEYDFNLIQDGEDPPEIDSARKEFNDAIRAVDRNLDAIVRTVGDQFNDYERLINQLGRGDFLAIITSTFRLNLIRTDTPFGKRLASCTAEAILRGAIVVWLCSEQALLDEYKAEYDFDQLESEAIFRADFESFKAKARETVNRTHPGKDHHRVIEDGCAILCFRRSPMVMPGFVVTLLGILHPGPDGNNRVDARIVMRMPGDEFGHLLFYPPCELFENRVRLFVKKEVKNQVEKNPERAPAITQLHRLLNNDETLLDEIVKDRWPPPGESDPHI